MYAPTSISLLALASLLAITSAAPVPGFERTYPNNSGGSSSTISTDTASQPTSTGDSFESSNVPSHTYPGGSSTLPADIASGVFPTASPTAFPSGAVPTGGFSAGAVPTGGFSAGAVPTGGFSAGAFPTGGFSAGAVPTGGFSAGVFPSGVVPTATDASPPNLNPTAAPAS